MEQAILYFRKRDVGFYYFKKGRTQETEIYACFYIRPGVADRYVRW